MGVERTIFTRCNSPAEQLKKERELQFRYKMLYTLKENGPLTTYHLSKHLPGWNTSRLTQRLRMLESGSFVRLSGEEWSESRLFRRSIWTYVSGLPQDYAPTDDDFTSIFNKPKVVKPPITDIPKPVKESTVVPEEEVTPVILNPMDVFIRSIVIS